MSNTPGQEWEYKTIKYEATAVGGEIDDSAKLDQMLNEQGAEGWELIAVIDTDKHLGHPRQVHFTFKRPVQSSK